MPPDALTGYRILDFGTAFASPMAAHLLADMGAEVIKIESHSRLDGLRLGRPIVGEDIAGAGSTGDDDAIGSTADGFADVSAGRASTASAGGGATGCR